jgi:hypothetical protein
MAHPNSTKGRAGTPSNFAFREMGTKQHVAPKNVDALRKSLTYID